MGEEGNGEDEEGRRGEDKKKKDPLRLRSADTSPTSVGEEEDKEEEEEKITGGTPVPRQLVDSAIAHCPLPIAHLKTRRAEAAGRGTRSI